MAERERERAGWRSWSEVQIAAAYRAGWRDFVLRPYVPHGTKKIDEGMIQNISHFH